MHPKKQLPVPDSFLRKHEGLSPIRLRKAVYKKYGIFVPTHSLGKRMKELAKCHEKRDLSTIPDSEFLQYSEKKSWLCIKRVRGPRN